MLEKKPFRRYNEKVDDNKPVVVKLNKDEKAWLKEGMMALQQSKKGTALKQLAYIGYATVIRDQKTKALLDFVMGNKRRNSRIGIVDVETEIGQL